MRGGTPLPIPNREVKPARADGTRRATSRESRSPPTISLKSRLERLFVVLGRAALLAALGIERAKPANSLVDRRVRHEQTGQPFLGERVDRVERLGGRARRGPAAPGRPGRPPPWH